MSQIQIMFVIWAGFGVVAMCCLAWLSFKKQKDDE